MRIKLKRILCGGWLTIIFIVFMLDYSNDVDYRPLEFRSESFVHRIMFAIDRQFFIRVFLEKYNDERIRKSILSRDQQAKTRPVWPERRLENDDGIVSQLNLQPESEFNKMSPEKQQLKKILVWSKAAPSYEDYGRRVFLEENCPVNSCYLLRSRHDLNEADLVLFHSVSYPGTALGPRPRDQIWMLSALEAPLRTEDWSQMDGLVNWTASYRHDSTVVTPYEKFLSFTNPDDVKVSQRNYAVGKKKHVAWFVSNCFGDNNRMDYANELSRYIDVDIYGECGPLKCPRGTNDEMRCFSKLNTDYKFFLAFENANCRDYITEKFFVRGLQHDVLPIVMGAAPEDYRRAAPYHSYIHVDEFRSPRELAAFLHLLDSNDAMYNSYFAWKGTGEFINTRFWCRVCALLHDSQRPHSVYNNLGYWWQGKHACIGGRPWSV